MAESTPHRRRRRMIAVWWAVKRVLLCVAPEATNNVRCQTIHTPLRTILYKTSKDTRKCTDGVRAVSHYIFLLILRGAMSSRGCFELGCRRARPSDGCAVTRNSQGTLKDGQRRRGSYSIIGTDLTISPIDDDSADDEISNDGEYLININEFF